MPKIKVKNIPDRVLTRYCHDRQEINLPCKTCQCFNEQYQQCTALFKDDTVLDLSEYQYPTNREWLESLSDEDLARVIACRPFPSDEDSYRTTVLMVKEWLSQPCKYLMEEENNANNL